MFIYLDIDGVLNTERNKYFHVLSPSGLPLYIPKMMERFYYIYNFLNAKVIISSTWRFDLFNKTEDGLFLKKTFDLYNIKISGYLPKLDNENDRFKFIEYTNKNTKDFIVLDDTKYPASENFYNNHFIQINPKYGLRDSNVKEIKRKVFKNDCK